MAVRKQHNRTKEQPMGKDIDEVIKKAKIYHKGWNEFYIFCLTVNNQKTYYSDGNNATGKAIKYYKNTAAYGERAKWVELPV